MLVLNRKPTSGWKIPRVAYLKSKQKTWVLYINGSCRVVHTGTVCTHRHTTGFTAQVKGLIGDERRPHIAPCKGPLYPFLLQWSVKLWETNDLEATELCATAKEKGGGGGSSLIGGPESRLSVFQRHPHHAVHRGVSHPSSSRCSPGTNDTETSAENQDALPNYPKKSSHLAFQLAA